MIVQKPHQVLLNEFGSLIINQRLQSYPAHLMHSNITNLWQIKGDWEIGIEKDSKIVIAFYLQRLNTRILVEVWILEVVKTNEQFVYSNCEFKKGQRLSLLLSRKVVTMLFNTPVFQEQSTFGKYKLIYTLNEEIQIPECFHRVTSPAIPCSSSKVAQFHINLHYQPQIVLSKDIRLVDKAQSKSEQGILGEIFKEFRKKTKSSLQIPETIEYFN